MNVLWKVLQIASLIVLPLAWGLAVEYVFERLRRKRRSHPGRGPDIPYDWII